jgi:hypothetical protein
VIQRLFSGGSWTNSLWSIGLSLKKSKLSAGAGCFAASSAGVSRAGGSSAACAARTRAP